MNRGDEVNVYRFICFRNWNNWKEADAAAAATATSTGTATAATVAAAAAGPVFAVAASAAAFVDEVGLEMIYLMKLILTSVFIIW